MNTVNVPEALQEDRQTRALIGLGLEAFQILLNEFISCLKEGQDNNRSTKRRKRKPGGGRKSVIGSPERQ